MAERPDVSGAPDFTALAGVADAILYEGYLLYPYRRSSPKNKARRQFGVLTPRGWLAGDLAADTGVTGSSDAWFQQTECLLDAGHRGDQRQAAISSCAPPLGSARPRRRRLRAR